METCQHRIERAVELGERCIARISSARHDGDEERQACRDFEQAMVDLDFARLDERSSLIFEKHEWPESNDLALFRLAADILEGEAA